MKYYVRLVKKILEKLISIIIRLPFGVRREDDNVFTRALRNRCRLGWRYKCNLRIWFHSKCRSLHCLLFNALYLNTLSRIDLVTMAGLDPDINSKIIIGEMDTTKCHWSNLFDDNEKKSLEGGLFITGILSIALGLWLNLILIFTNLGYDTSYKNLQNFTIAATIRRMIPFIAQIPLFKFIKSTDDHTSNEFFGFIDTFMAVFEVEALTHVCIERYVLAKYTMGGWAVGRYNYILFQFMCVVFAGIYSFPPLFGIGKYDFDFTCASYTFDIILPMSWDRYIVVAIFVLRSIKPAIVMLVMLTSARTMEKKLVYSQKVQKEMNFTQNMLIITVLNELCWLPIAIIKASIILSQLFYTGPIVMDSEAYIKWSIWIHWMSPALTAIALIIIDPRIRNSMLHPRLNNNAIEDNKNE